MTARSAIACSASLALGVGAAGCGGSGSAIPPPQPANPGGHDATAHAPGTDPRLRVARLAIRPSGLFPRKLTARAGVPVEWTNHDDRSHTIRSTHGSRQRVRSGPIAPGDSFRMTLERRGRLLYRASAHDEGQSFTGRIDVF